MSAMSPSKKSKYLSRARKTLLLAVMLAIGASFGAEAAGAREWHGDRRGHRDHRDFHRHHREYWGYRGWTGGYYAAPPVVYGYPYYDPYYYPDYYPPPVVYGPGLSFNFRVH
jgi:hypothetical protein